MIGRVGSGRGGAPMIQNLRPITKFLVGCMMALAATSSNLARAQFVPGHVFVSVGYSEGCFNAEFEGILEFDPVSGEASVFADSDDGLCFPDGLAFTPMGDRLLSSNFGSFWNSLGWVLSFAPDGSNSVVLDGDDGLANPSGFNNIAYDRQGNLYVVTGDNWYIMRYTPERTSEVFADADDGVVFQGSITVAANGDVFFCSHRTDEVIRITPNGVGTLFDVLDSPRALTFDRRGNLFVGSSSTDIYRYEGAIAANRELVASGYAFSLGALTVSPDQRELYVATVPLEGNLTTLFAIDTQNGSSTFLAASPLPNEWGIGWPRGIAVHVNYEADIDADADIDLVDFAMVSNQLIDLNDDGEADAADFTVLVGALTGP